jgi:hypothetical protein
LDDAAEASGLDTRKDLGFRKPTSFVSELLTYRTFAHNFVKLAAHVSQAFSGFVTYLLYELL